MSILKRILIFLFYRTKKEEAPVNGADRNLVITRAKQKRSEAENRISNMIAQVDGCGDRWFLRPMQTIDECLPEEGDQDDR